MAEEEAALTAGFERSAGCPVRPQGSTSMTVWRASLPAGVLWCLRGTRCGSDSRVGLSEWCVPTVCRPEAGGLACGDWQCMMHGTCQVQGSLYGLFRLCNKCGGLSRLRLPLKHWTLVRCLNWWCPLACSCRCHRRMLIYTVKPDIPPKLQLVYALTAVRLHVKHPAGYTTAPPQPSMIANAGRVCKHIFTKPKQCPD
jgi:hypothetical protein